jgi:predicted amidophosphoribosyltransferase
MSIFINPERENSERILSLGWYLPSKSQLDVTGMLRFARSGRDTGYRAGEIRDLVAATRHTRAIDALNRGRKWALKQFTEQLDRLLAENITIVVVPGHTPFGDDPPLRELGRALCLESRRADGTGCLMRTEKIRRISYGGPSYRQLHRDTIEVRQPELLRDRPVLLLDDIVKSGASLRACRELLDEHGATEVQALALGRVG